MPDVILTLFRFLLSSFKSRARFGLEDLALRHQLALLKRQARKPKLCPTDRLLWVRLLRFSPHWQKALLLFQPQTVMAWHRLGFHLFWRWKSRLLTKRPTVNRDLICLMHRSTSAEFGAPLICD